MTDREMLELAARAAGVKLWHAPGMAPRNVANMPPEGNALAAPRWCPFTDNGDAFQLAVQLHIRFATNENGFGYVETEDGKFYREFSCGSDPCAMVRWEIVRAAAAIGEQMEKRA